MTPPLAALDNAILRRSFSPAFSSLIMVVEVTSHRPICERRLPLSGAGPAEIGRFKPAVLCTGFGKRMIFFFDEHGLKLNKMPNFFYWGLWRKSVENSDSMISKKINNNNSPITRDKW